MGPSALHFVWNGGDEGVCHCQESLNYMTLLCNLLFHNYTSMRMHMSKRQAHTSLPLCKRSKVNSEFVLRPGWVGPGAQLL